LVVATFLTLANRLDRTDLDWALCPDVVVIDEAHGSITPSYTQILNRLGLDQRTTARPLIGLTATPFRGDRDERETFRLAFRFEHRRFDIALGEAPDLYCQLQEAKILAYADHERLEGEDLVLYPEELSELRTFNRLPSAAEIRLGANEDRNERILGHIKRQPRDWPILLFSASVEHAEDLAVRLSMDGIPSCAISGNTSPGRRRHAIDAFKNGTVRVLTNYGVLTTGFDAPSVRAVYVTRPVYSPVLYQQMIGRGLRGPRNGGKPRCLIVNVADNIRQYGEELAFHRFEHLWRNG
jgi:superfamily II DNA or RNA helicase